MTDEALMDLVIRILNGRPDAREQLFDLLKGLLEGGVE